MDNLFDKKDMKTVKMAALLLALNVCSDDLFMRESAEGHVWKRTVHGPFCAACINMEVVVRHHMMGFSFERMLTVATSVCHHNGF